MNLNKEVTNTVITIISIQSVTQLKIKHAPKIIWLLFNYGCKITTDHRSKKISSPSFVLLLYIVRRLLGEYDFN